MHNNERFLGSTDDREQRVRVRSYSCEIYNSNELYILFKEMLLLVDEIDYDGAFPSLLDSYEL